MKEFFDMALMPINLLFYFFSYALASVPTAYLVALFIHRIDVKKNPRGHSAIYIWRNVSKKSGALVFLLDFLKGVIPCAIAFSLRVPVEIIALIALVAVLGHCFSPWLNFNGGRGAATAAGAFLFIYWPASIFGILVFLLFMLIGFKADRASLISVIIGLCVLMLGEGDKIVWFIALAMMVIIALCHWRYARRGEIKPIG